MYRGGGCCAPVTEFSARSFFPGSENYFPVCWLFALLLLVTTETVVGGLRVESQNLSFLVDTEGEGRNRGPDEVPEEREKR